MLSGEGIERKTIEIHESPPKISKEKDLEDEKSLSSKRTNDGETIRTALSLPDLHRRGQE